ncbi:MAG: formylglycine-generating enzyme family protein [Dehalococcoidaceae bacterium]|nr:formylglycine-generating enzyme family protein [Dehalococcoidaceae bacterium]
MKRLKTFSMVLATVLTLGSCSTGQATVPAPVYDTGINPENWIKIPAGSFRMGQFEHETLIPYDYEISVTPVTNRQYAGFLNEALDAGVISVSGNVVSGYYPGDEFHGGRHEVEIVPGDYIYFMPGEADSRIIYQNQQFQVKSGYQDHPVTMVSWFGAWAYADYYGYRLPAETEWEKAARGLDGRPYPWGNGIAGANANYYASGDPFEESTGAIGNTTPVGFYNGGVYDGFVTLDSASPFGVYDMAGNVWEWTADIYEGTHLRYLRGGSRNNYAYDLRLWNRNSAHPEYCGPSEGFRVVRNP